MSFKAQNEKIYAAPVIFGPQPCMIQNGSAQRYEGVQALVRQYNLAYEVDQTALEEFLVEGMELAAPNLLLRFEVLENVAWLAGRSINRVELLVPVRMNGKTGLYNMVTWENNGDSILAGRDVQGHAKVYACIEEEADGSSCFKAKSWDFEFLKADFVCGSDLATDEIPDHLKGDDGTFHYKYLPRTGEGFVKPDADYVLFAEAKDSVMYKLCDNATFEWRRPAFEDAPTQYHYIQKIEALMPKRIICAYFAEFERIDDGYDQIKIG